MLSMSGAQQAELRQSCTCIFVCGRQHFNRLVRGLLAIVPVVAALAITEPPLPCHAHHYSSNRCANSHASKRIHVWLLGSHSDQGCVPVHLQRGEGGGAWCVFSGVCGCVGGGGDGASGESERIEGVALAVQCSSCFSRCSTTQNSTGSCISSCLLLHSSHLHHCCTVKSLTHSFHNVKGCRGGC